MKLKDKTKKLHKKAEQQSFSQRMIKGDLSKKEYIEYLKVLYSIFKELEKGELPHEDLSRVEQVIQDIKELNGQVEESKLAEVYVKYLGILPKEKRLPHVYLNYLAIMFGGSIIKENTQGSGRVYEFENHSECLKSIRKIQSLDWAEEVNRGYIFWIEIYGNLQKQNDKK